MEEKVYDILDKLKIKYESVTHVPLHHVEDSKKVDIHLRGIGCKTLFLKDKSNKFYLYVLRGEKRADLKNVAEKIESTRLSFGKEDELYNATKLVPGSVSPFGIINNNGEIIVLIDDELQSNNIIVHPNINTLSISITCDLIESLI